MNASLMRKSFVTKVHQERPDMKVNLATQMCHSVQTAENVYFLTDKKEKAALTSNFMREIIRNSDKKLLGKFDELEMENLNKKIVI